MAYELTEDAILDSVYSLVWSGECDEKEVALSIDRIYEGEEIDKNWLRNEIKREFEFKLKEEESWPTATNFDRLERVFARLKSRGVIAVHRAGFAQSDGLLYVEHLNREAGGKYWGYCFYTDQDQDVALDGGGLYLSCGHYPGYDDKSVKVGQTIRAALKFEGFKVEWGSSIKNSVFVKDFEWQRRSPRKEAACHTGGTTGLGLSALTRFALRRDMTSL